MSQLRNFFTRAIFRTGKKSTVRGLIVPFRIYSIDSQARAPSIFDAPIKKTFKVMSPFLTNFYPFSAIGSIGSSARVMASHFDGISNIIQRMFAKVMGGRCSASTTLGFSNPKIVSIGSSDISTFTKACIHWFRVIIASFSVENRKLTKLFPHHFNRFSSQLNFLFKDSGVHNGI